MPLLHTHVASLPPTTLHSPSPTPPLPPAPPPHPPVWNWVVSTITLMALGSSAPEILLSIIETVTRLGEPAGKLGPAVVVGAAAFNVFNISEWFKSPWPKRQPPWGARIRLIVVLKPLNNFWWWPLALGAGRGGGGAAW